jgi:hypothetical protein
MGWSAATNGVADFSLFRTVDWGSAIVSALNPPQLSRHGSSGPRRRESHLADNVRVPRQLSRILVGSFGLAAGLLIHLEAAQRLASGRLPTGTMM